MKELLFFKPIFKEKIWGGNRMRIDYKYDIPSEYTGEAWVISAHPHGDCQVISGIYKGKTLSYLWSNHREIFGGREGEVFPLLIKIIEAKEDLSVQVHPDDNYAMQYENGALGKTECWYVLDCEPNSEIVIGHTARTKKEFKQMVTHGQWENLLRKYAIRRGSFFQIAPGTLHSICKGTIILEIQQNSDITYRLYDYDRLEDGKRRELHLDKALDVVTCPSDVFIPTQRVERVQNSIKTQLVRCPFYHVDKWEIAGRVTIYQEFSFLIVDVIEGKGMINNVDIEKGQHFIIPAQYGKCDFKGELVIIVSHI